MKKYLVLIGMGVWSVLCLLLPTWIFTLARPSAAGLWKPLDILQSWLPGIKALYAYSPSYAIASCAVLVVCIVWWLRMPCFFYGLLLLAASTMCGPTWVEVARLWNSFVGV